MNSQDENYRNYFEILEVDETASLADINNAYKKLKKLYSSDSIVTDPIDDEFSLEERQLIVQQIEEAYKKLVIYVVEKDRSQKIEESKEEILEDTRVEGDEILERNTPPPDQEIEENINSSQEKFEEKEEIFILEDEIPQAESLATIVAPSTTITPTESHGEEKQEIFQHHENIQEHEPLHIELSENDHQNDIQLENSSYLNNDEVNHDPKPITDSHAMTSTKEDIWEESLFEKDLDDIKKEITKDLTEDNIYNELTISQKPPDESSTSDQKNLLSVPIKGKTLKKVREDLGIGIHEVALATKIHYKILVNIEKERFAKLPKSGYLRWYLMTYAKELNLNPKQVADEYMKRFRYWQKNQEVLS